MKLFDLNFLSGKYVLITSGYVKEVIDGIRYFANYKRCIFHGKKIAEIISTAGAHVDLIDIESSLSSYPENIRIIHTTNGKKIISSKDLLNTCEDIIRNKYFDYIFILSSGTMLKPTVTFNEKLKAKNREDESLQLTVTSNTDVYKKLSDLFPSKTILGYDNLQNFFGINISLDKFNILKKIIEKTSLSIDCNQFLTIKKEKINRKLYNKKIIITAGPTSEILTTTGDVITNFSSGRQGAAIANALTLMGAKVIVISGTRTIACELYPTINFQFAPTAHLMRSCCWRNFPADVFISVAAVADFKLQIPSKLILQEKEKITLNLTQNPDILSEIGHHPFLRPKMVIGFAAETESLLLSAKNKLIKKGADAICANYVGERSLKRGHDNNQITYVTPNATEKLAEMSKRDIGFWLGEKIYEFFSRS